VDQADRREGVQGIEDRSSKRRRRSKDRDGEGHRESGGCGAGCLSGWRILGLLLGAGWLYWLVRSLWRLCRSAGRDSAKRNDGTVPPWAYRQPDPLIYSQQYLQAQGLAVTWDNPDIHLELAATPGVPVDSHSLKPATDYIVVARVWNGATTAPALGLPVKVSYLEFGIGTTRHDVGQTGVDLAVKGAAGCPAFALVPWRTPATAGHYCLQVEVLWDDDANPANNMGQHNTDVKALNSPHATFTFPVRNDGADRRALAIQVDSYQIPPLEECPPAQRGSDGHDRRQELLDRHLREAWPIPSGWTVDAQPPEAVLAPGESVDVTVDITAPDGFLGRQQVNVRATSGPALIGGVTLYVDGSG